MPTLGDIIRTARLRKGWSQSELARLVGVSRAAIGQWESNETAPTRRHAPSVAKALDLPLGAIDPRQPQGVVPLDTTTSARTIPILEWEALMQRGRALSPVGYLSVELDTPEDAVALRVIDDAMAPDIVSGEMITVSFNTAPLPHDYVIAQVGEGPHILRRYHPRGADRHGRQVFDLLSTSPDYPTITCNSANDGKVLAVVIAHTRRLRRMPG